MSCISPLSHCFIHFFTPAYSGRIIHDMPLVYFKVVLCMRKYLPSMHVEAKRGHLQEGHVYSLSRFLVCPNKDNCRSVNNEYMIELTYYTEIKELADIPHNFPMYAYSLVTFADLISSYVGETRLFSWYISAHKPIYTLLPSWIVSCFFFTILSSALH